MTEDLNTLREALEPCPWCGELITNATVIEGSTFRWRKVQGCCTDGPEVRHDTLAKDQKAAEADSRARAIAAWNRRAPRLEAAAVPVGEVKTVARPWPADMTAAHVERLKTALNDLGPATKQAVEWVCEAALVGLNTPPAPIEGWRLVPVEPTPEMIEAAYQSDREYSRRNFGDGALVMQGPYDHYVAMLAAAPQPGEKP